uniref:Uncharacterized protein n=1 Tax=Pithovirus LCPAC201 TaxID=2506591 RepID=A0A481Z886_9VIRU|nr:MAG: hypothetical protein LCPAC201_02120 [Pithovirus LCPAC201]
MTDGFGATDYPLDHPLNHRIPKTESYNHQVTRLRDISYDSINNENNSPKKKFLVNIFRRSTKDQKTPTTKKNQTGK